MKINKNTVFKITFLFVVFLIGCYESAEQTRLGDSSLVIKKKYKVFYATAKAENHIKALKTIYRVVVEYSIKVLIGEDIFEKGRNEIVKLLDAHSQGRYSIFFIEEINKIKVLKERNDTILISVSTALKYELIINILKKAGYLNFNIKALLEASSLIRTETQGLSSDQSSVIPLEDRLKNKRIALWYEKTDISLPPSLVENIITFCEKKLSSLGIRIVDLASLKREYQTTGSIKAAMKSAEIDYLIVFSDETKISRLNPEFLKISSLIKLKAYKNDLSLIQKNSTFLKKTFKNFNTLIIEISNNILSQNYLNILEKIAHLQNIKSFVLVFINSPSISYSKSFLMLLDPKMKISLVRLKNNKAYFKIRYIKSKDALKRLILTKIENGVFKNKFIFSNFQKNLFELKYKGVY